MVDGSRRTVFSRHHRLDERVTHRQVHRRTVGRDHIVGRNDPDGCPAVILRCGHRGRIDAARHSRRVVGGGGGKGRRQRDRRAGAIGQRQAAERRVVRGGARDVHHVDLGRYPVGRGHHHLDQIGADVQVVARLPGGAGVVCVYEDRGGACLARRRHCGQRQDAAGNCGGVYAGVAVERRRQRDCGATAVRQGECAQRGVAQ